MKKLLFTLALPLLCLSNINAQSTSAIKQVSTHSLDSLMTHTPIYQIIDVRTEKEYNEKHIKGALNQNVSEKKFWKNFKKQFPSKEITYILYCRTGKRSMNAANILIQGGYKIINLTEGITSVPDEFLWKDPSIKIQNYSDTTKSTSNQ